jgi:hypothetical protein
MGTISWACSLYEENILLTKTTWDSWLTEGDMNLKLRCVLGNYDVVNSWNWHLLASDTLQWAGLFWNCLAKGILSELVVQLKRSFPPTYVDHSVWGGEGVCNKRELPFMFAGTVKLRVATVRWFLNRAMSICSGNKNEATVVCASCIKHVNHNESDRLTDTGKPGVWKICGCQKIKLFERIFCLDTVSGPLYFFSLETLVWRSCPPCVLPQLTQYQAALLQINLCLIYLKTLS